MIQNTRFANTKVAKTLYIPEPWNSSPASRTKETVERLSLFAYISFLKNTPLAFEWKTRGVLAYKIIYELR